MINTTPPPDPASPLLSVVMPTHNRALYATHAIRSVLAIESDQLELVVNDTSDDQALADFVGGVEDPRLVYAHCDEPLSMTENHNRAVGRARGRYVCLIGDDDSILPEVLQVADWASRLGVAAVAPEVVANYAWPDFRSRAFGRRHAGRLYMRRRFGGVGLRRGDESLSQALARAALGTSGLPKVYHGVVSRLALERVRESAGAFFYGTSPDVSGAVAVASKIGRYVWIDYPLTLPGASALSNTGRSATRTHTGDLEEDPHTRRFRDLRWPDVLPRFVSVETIWAHAAHATLEAIAPDALGHFNFPRLYAECLLRSFGYRRAVLAAARSWQAAAGVSDSSLRRRLAVEYCRVGAASWWRLAKRASRPSAAGGRLFRDGVANIAACAEPYDELLAKAAPRASLGALLDRAEDMLHSS